MYQTISYNYYTKKVIIRDDELGWQEIDYKPTYYKLDKEGEFVTLDGRRVSPTQEFDKTQPQQYFEIDIPVETNALVDIYKNSDDTAKWHNIVYLDIECEIGGALTVEYIKRAPMKITSIALYDVTLKKYYCLILDEKRQINQTTEDNKEIIPYNTEKDLLRGFLDKWEECDPTIISGWNSEFFDIPYLYHRMCQVLGNQHANRLSPLKKCKVMDFGQDRSESTVKIEGVNHLDYMLLHKKFIMKQEPSYKLDSIGEKYAGINKIEYEGSLDDLFERDVHKFIEYNLRDVEILVALDDKLQFIALTQNICHLCHTSYENIYYATALNEGAILTYLRRENIVSPNKPTTMNPALRAANEEYAGGYLKDPIPGLYQWVSDLDFTSLYPSIIRNLNMGIETLVARIKNRDKYDNQWGLADLKQLDPNKVLHIERVDAQRKVQTVEMSVQQVIDFVESKNMVIAANGTIFRTDKDSIVAKILDDWFAKRKEYKNLMKQAYKAGDKELGEFYNKRQHAFKIKLNDVYGCYAINSWRYSDGSLFISKAITLTGQRLITESIKFVNKSIAEELGEI
jgi:DNA polymerase elongation subunit (family B)